MFPQCSTLEYRLPAQQQGQVMPPAYLLVVDTCVDHSELAHLKIALRQVLNEIPEYCMLGLITFGTHVQVYELGMSECTKAYVFRGTKDYTAAQI